MRSVGRTLVGPGLLALVVGAGLGGCTTTAIPEAGGSTGYHLSVQRDGRVLGEFDLAGLHDLPQTQIDTPQSHGNPVQRGPSVRAVLAAAGAGDVHRVRFEGRDPAQTLTAEELTDQVVLSFTKRDTVKLAGVDLDRDRWVRDVNTVVVDP